MIRDFSARRLRRGTGSNPAGWEHHRLTGIRCWPWALMLLTVLLAGCASRAELDLPLTPDPNLLPSSTPSLPTPTVHPTPLPPPPPTLVVCLAQEPLSLYAYAETSREADIILEAIYDGPFDIRDYQVEPVILEGIPTFENGGARLEITSVALDEVYLNPESGQPKNLALGDLYAPAGCTSPLCLARYWGGEVEMERMVVDFSLRSDVTWSDGQPLTAGDSVFAFEVDADIDTPTIKYLVDRTLAYEAIDETTVRWIGIPGFMDGAYQTNFYSPLPSHVLGQYTPAELLSLEMAVGSPMGWGAYRIQDWQAGEQIVLERNPNYFRAGEGLPHFERLVFRFLGDVSPQGAVQQVITGECDLVDEALLPVSSLSLVREQQDEGRVGLAWAPGRLMERLELIISPGDLAEPAFFLDASTREAIGRCIDREAILREELDGLGEVPNSYLPPGHPLYSPAEGWMAYDPEAGRARLREAGWDLIEGASGPSLRARVVFGVEAGTAFSVALAAGDGSLARAVADRIQGDLAACGIQVEVEHLAPTDLYAAWPDGPLFGRQVNMGLWAWPNHILPACEMFMDRERAGEDRPLGINASGLQDAEFDQACQSTMIASPASQAYSQAVEDTQELFRALVPAVPLYSRPRLMVYRPGICGVALDSSSLTGLWNIEAIGEGASCD